MPAVKDLARSSAKWVRQSGAAAEEYAAGIRNPRRDWAEATKSAASTYKTAITQAAAEGRFEKGVAKAGTGKWQKNAIEKGVARWPEGIRVGEANWADGFSPYANILRSTTLSPRGPKGSPQNYKRVQEVGDALHKGKLSRT